MAHISRTELDALVACAQRGDEAAFRRLVEETHRDLRRFVAVHASSVDMIEEVVQMAYIACFEELRTYEPRGTFLPWLMGIARNRLRRELSERARCPGAGLEGLELLVIAAAPPPEDADDPDADRRGRLPVCLGKLAPSARLVVERFYRDGCSLNELAQQFHKKRLTMAMMLSRIRAGLRQCLDQTGATP